MAAERNGPVVFFVLEVSLSLYAAMPSKRKKGVQSDSDDLSDLDLDLDIDSDGFILTKTPGNLAAVAGCGKPRSRGSSTDASVSFDVIGNAVTHKPSEVPKDGDSKRMGSRFARPRSSYGEARNLRSEVRQKSQSGQRAAIALDEVIPLSEKSSNKVPRRGRGRPPRKSPGTCGGVFGLGIVPFVLKFGTAPFLDNLFFFGELSFEVELMSQGMSDDGKGGS